ncbi:Larval/pupal cuticle protein H1C [Orchesella cincta]|uniref:Larval/pupal cuticle protein H1C n=1 Tax=Orchesella cincta TaxID=48709 RepID=A0A1D2NKQ5_ORCCI|nr:Larval/pupal cuticle protein H1C [Orchesella cincta]
MFSKIAILVTFAAAASAISPGYVDSAYALGSQAEHTVRGFGGLSSVSKQAKAVDSAYSTVRKSDIRYTNDAGYAAHPVAYGHGYASPAGYAHGYASPAGYAHGYAAPAGYAHGYAAPAYAHHGYAGPALAHHGYAAPAGVAYAHRGYAGPAVAHHAAPIGYAHGGIAAL